VILNGGLVLVLSPISYYYGGTIFLSIFGIFGIFLSLVAGVFVLFAAAMVFQRPA